MKCPYCSAKIPPRRRVCPICMREVRQIKDRPASLFRKTISFLIPVLGVFFFLLYNNEMPTRSKQCLYAALMGVAFYWLLFGVGLVAAKSFIMNHW